MRIFFIAVKWYDTLIVPSLEVIINPGRICDLWWWLHPGTNTFYISFLLASI